MIIRAHRLTGRAASHDLQHMQLVWVCWTTSVLNAVSKNVVSLNQLPVLGLGWTQTAGSTWGLRKLGLDDNKIIQNVSESYMG